MTKLVNTLYQLLILGPECEYSFTNISNKIDLSLTPKMFRDELYEILLKGSIDGKEKAYDLLIGTWIEAMSSIEISDTAQWSNSENIQDPVFISNYIDLLGMRRDSMKKSLDLMNSPSIGSLYSSSLIYNYEVTLFKSEGLLKSLELHKQTLLTG